MCITYSAVPFSCRASVGPRCCHNHARKISSNQYIGAARSWIVSAPHNNNKSGAQSHFSYNTSSKVQQLPTLISIARCRAGVDTSGTGSIYQVEHKLDPFARLSVCLLHPLHCIPHRSCNIDHAVEQGPTVPRALRPCRIRQNAGERGYVSSQLNPQ